MVAVVLLMSKFLNFLQAAATRRDPAATVVVVSVSADQVLDKIKTKVGPWDSPQKNLKIMS